MKIWIDMTNSPHVNFFAGMVNELKEKHDILITCRPLANTIELLDLYKFSYTIVGEHYGKSKLKKFLGFFIRVFQLFIFLRKQNIDVSISHSSFYSPLVSRLLGVKSIYLNDNEYAEGNRISFLFANIIMAPEFIDIKRIKRQWARAEKIIQYPGIKEGIYLWYCNLNSTNGLKINETDKKVIFIRPEPLTAQYYNGKENFFDDLLLQLKDNYRIILMPRNENQEEYYKQDIFSGIIILEKSIGLCDIMDHCDLFIGAGGTMTRESAVLGIPTISIYQERLLKVDEFLIKNGNMLYSKNLNLSLIINFLKNSVRKMPDEQLLNKGKQAYELIKTTLLNLNAKNGANYNA